MTTRAAYRNTCLVLAGSISLWWPAEDARGEDFTACPEVAAIAPETESVESLSRLARCAAAAGQEALAFLLARRAVSLRPDDQGLVELADTMRSQASDAGMADGRLSEADPATVYWLSVSTGHDSNINGGSDAREIALPLLGNRRVSLNELLIARRSSVVEASFGAVATYPINTLLSLRANGLGSLRYNVAEAAYLPHNYRAAIGLEASPAWGQIGVDLMSTQRWLARFHVVDERTLTTRISYFMATDLLAGAKLSRTARRYPYFDDYRARRDDFGLGLAHLASGFQLTVTQGRQRGERERRELDSRGDGFAIDWNRQITPAYRLRVSWQETRDRYDLTSILFRTRREDKTQLQSVEIEHGLGGKWFLTPRYLREETRSNLALATMQREQWLLELRREF